MSDFFEYTMMEKGKFLKIAEWQFNKASDFFGYTTMEKGKFPKIAEWQFNKISENQRKC